MKRAPIWLAVLMLGGVALAQQSASFKLEEHTFNAGGNPDAGFTPTSASFEISLDSLGEAVSALGLSSASFFADGCFSSAYPPPGEVTGLLFSDKETLAWDPEKSVGDYSLYRDLISNITGLGFGNCEQEDLADETATDADAVPVDDGYFYLVTAENRLDEEGTKGFRTGSIERMGTACP